MTRSPSRSPHIRGIEGEPYEVNPICAAPGCHQPAVEKHHLYRRSSLGGPFWWVEVEPGVVFGNLVGLCSKHHQAVTVDAAWVSLEEGVFVWCNLFNAGVPLSWQPPFRHDGTSDNGSQPLTEAPVAPEAQLDGTCPTCLRPYPHKHAKREPARIRRTWSITVPKDERENGAEMLDTLLEEARQELAKRGLPYGDAEAARYFVLSTIIALFVQHANEVLA